MTRRFQVVFGLLAFLVLGGPSQGAVGSCSDKTDPLSGPAEVAAYCDEREQMVCVRSYERGELSTLQRDNCRRKAIAVCKLRDFLPGCAPSQREAQACLAALHSRSTLDRTISQIKECNSLCDFDPDSASVQLNDGGAP